MGSPEVLLAFQRRWVADDSPIKLCVKSRQIGLTWCNAAEDVLVAAADSTAGGMNCWYLAQSEKDTRTYIEDVISWAEAMGHLVDRSEEQIVDPTDKIAIQVLAVVFRSGFAVRAMVGHPRNLRGKRGKVTFDEAAYNDNAHEFIPAARAFLRWGGRIAIISTEWSTETAFHKWREDIEAGKLGWSLHVITFDDALADGLYRRVCEKRGLPYTREAELAMRAEEIRDLGDDADRELFCIPVGASDIYLDRATVEACMHQGRPVVRLKPPRENEEGVPFIDWPQGERDEFVDAWCAAELKPALDALSPAQSHALGADFGRSGDITVIVPMATTHTLKRSVPFVVEMRATTFDAQRRVYRYIIDRLPRRAIMALDAGLQGSELAEVMRQRYGTQIVGINIIGGKYREPDARKGTSLNYPELLPPLKRALQERTLELPADDLHVADLMGLRMVNGMPCVPPVRTNKGQSGQRHCDFAVGLALALWASFQGAADWSAYETDKPRREASQWRTAEELDALEDDREDLDRWGI